VGKIPAPTPFRFHGDDEEAKSVNFTVADSVSSFSFYPKIQSQNSSVFIASYLAEIHLYIGRHSS